MFERPVGATTRSYEKSFKKKIEIEPHGRKESVRSIEHSSLSLFAQRKASIFVALL